MCQGLAKSPEMASKHRKDYESAPKPKKGFLQSRPVLSVSLNYLQVQKGYLTVLGGYLCGWVNQLGG